MTQIFQDSFLPAPAGLYAGLNGGSVLGPWAVGGEGADHVGTYWQSADGDGANLDLNALGPGSISTPLSTRSGWEAGATYRVSFSLAGNPDSWVPTAVRVTTATSTQDYSFSVADVDGAGTKGTHTNMGWKRYTFTFTSAATDSLTFASLDPPGDMCGPALDNIVVEKVGTTSGVGSDVRQLFTGKERDGETGLDYFESRYFSSAQGRFTSPDAMLAKKEWLPDPQRWNRYAYVRNNPLRFVDPNGEDLVVYYWDSQNLTEEQRKWLNENRQKVLDTIRDCFTKAGIKNVEFRAGNSLTADQIKQLPGRVGIGQLNFQNTTNIVGEQFGVGAKGQTLGNSGVGMGPSQIFLGNLSDANFLGLRIPGFGLSGSDLATGAGEVGAHELGHRLGFDVVPESMYRLRPDNLLTEGMGNPNPSGPLYFRPTKDDRRVIDEINRIGDNTPKRRE